MSVTLTLFHDGSFFVALAERREGGALSVARQVFGPEPSDPEVYNWVLQDYIRLVYSPAVEGGRAPRLAENPKRRQRQAARTSAQPTSTRSQQALQLQREQIGQERKDARRARVETEAERKYLLRQEKKKQRRRGRR